MEYFVILLAAISLMATIIFIEIVMRLFRFLKKKFTGKKSEPMQVANNPLALSNNILMDLAGNHAGACKVLALLNNNSNGFMALIKIMTLEISGTQLWEMYQKNNTNINDFIKDIHDY